LNVLAPMLVRLATAASWATVESSFSVAAG